MKKKVWLALASITLVGLGLRIWQLSSLPGTFFVDEVLIGYVGRFIWQNGVDLYGNRWPLLYFNNFGDYYIIGPMYLAGLSNLLLGSSEFAVRLPTAIFGVLTIPGLYWLARQLKLERTQALVAAGLLAVSPWHVVLSRASTESVIEVCLIVLGLASLLQALQPKTRHAGWWLGIAAGLSLAAYWMYHSSRLQIPLIWLAVAVVQLHNWLKRRETTQITWLQIGLSVFFLSLTLLISQTVWGKGRFDQTSIFGEQAAVVERSKEMIYNLGPDQVLTAKFFHNKYIGYGREFLRQYFTYFSPNYLLMNGWAADRYEVPEVGPNFLITGLFFVVGLYAVFLSAGHKQKNGSYYWLIIWLLLIAPIPASLSFLESPNVRRSLLLVIPYLLISAIGASFLWTKLGQMGWGSWRWLVLPIILLETTFFWHFYAKQSDRITSLVRGDGFREVAQYVAAHQAEVGTFYLPSRGFLPAQYLFFTENYDANLAGQFGSSTHLDNFENIKFIDNDCPTGQVDVAKLQPSDLIIDVYTCGHNSGSVQGLQLVDEISGVNQYLKYPVFRLTPTVDSSGV